VAKPKGQPPEGLSEWLENELRDTKARLHKVEGELEQALKHSWSLETEIRKIHEAMTVSGSAVGQLSSMREELRQVRDQVSKAQDRQAAIAVENSRLLRETEFGRSVRFGELPLAAGRAAALYDEPAKLRGEAVEGEGGILPTLRGIIEGAQREVILISPYFIPSARGLEVLGSLAQRGVRVRVLTNSLASTDPVPLAHAGYARYRGRLLARGVELHERRPGAARLRNARPGLSSGATLHAKAVVVDRKLLLVGSMNLDPRSRLSNTEVAVLVESEALAAELATLFDEASSLEQAFHVELAERANENAPLVWLGRERGEQVRYEDEPLTGWWRRMLSRLLGALAPEELL